MSSSEYQPQSLFDEPVSQPAGEFQSDAKQPVIPFMRLTREIGISPVEDVEAKELTPGRQQKIYDWVSKVKKPFDLIQRAEGLETPEMVYYGGQQRAVKNIEPGIVKAETAGRAGRASVRRQYDRTSEHLDIASYRFAGSQRVLAKLAKKKPLDEAERSVVQEVLQELANGIAANLDNEFPGGDEWARIAGNSVLSVASQIENGELEPATQTTLIAAAANYVKKQTNLWQRKQRQIRDFAAANNFSVGKPKEK